MKKVRVRRSWKVKPATRIEKDKKKYDRKKAKRELRANDD